MSILTTPFSHRALTFPLFFVKIIIFLDLAIISSPLKWQLYLCKPFYIEVVLSNKPTPNGFLQISYIWSSGQNRPSCQWWPKISSGRMIATFKVAILIITILCFVAVDPVSSHQLLQQQWSEKKNSDCPPSVGIAIHIFLQLYSARLGICQKIYRTEFSGERILHTENA